MPLTRKRSKQKIFRSRSLDWATMHFRAFPAVKISKVFNDEAVGQIAPSPPSRWPCSLWETKPKINGHSLFRWKQFQNLFTALVVSDNSLVSFLHQILVSVLGEEEYHFLQ